MYCKHCDKEISDDSRFCRFCGKPLVEGTGGTISAGGDAYKNVDVKGTAAVGGGQVIQIKDLHVQGMSEEQVRKIISSQLSPILSEIGIKDEIGSEPIELTQEQQEIGEAIKDKVDEVDQLFNEPLGTPDTYLRLGSFEFMNKNYEKAVEYFNNIIKMDISNSVAWIGKGITLCMLGRSDDAIKCYDKALEINPEYADVWTIKGFVLGNLGRYDEAIGCYNIALKIDPTHKYAKENRKIAKKKKRQ